MARTLRSDKLLIWATLLLVGASLVMVYSASAVQSLDKQGTASYVLVRQLIWAVIGLGMLLAAMRVDYHELRRPEVIWSLLGVTSLALVAVFFFKPSHGASRWITFGSYSVQPSELAKLVAIFFTAALLERRMHRINDA